MRAATFDGDTETEARDWIRRHSSYVLTNPDMLHHSMLPRHPRWAGFLRRLDYVVVDECHHYRGVFGSHVATILRRLRRVCAHYGSDPTFVLASATVSDPAASASRLVGMPVAAVDVDASPRGETVFALWEPPLTELAGERGAPVRRAATAEVGDLLADLVADGVRTVAFVRSRRAAESVAANARRLLDEVEPGLSGRVAAYRAGYLPEERRALERALQSGELLGVASTNALELGVDISGLDAVLLTGYPGTRASLWQQAGRAGREAQGALAVLVARDDPLDTYLTHHPEALFGRPVEATVFDPDNPYVLAPHLCAAAAELPVTDDDLALFGPAAAEAAEHLVTRGLLRRRAAGLFWTGPDRASDLADIRGTGAAPVRLVEEETGRLLGTVDGGAAHGSAHAGAVYVHQGETYLVRSLDLAEHVAMLERAAPDYSTFARDVTDIRVLETETSTAWGPVELSFGTVQVTNQVVSFLRKRMITGEVLSEEPLDLPPRTLRTRSVWWTVDAGGAGRGRAGVGRRTRRRPRRGACRDRPAPPLRDVRPVGHRRGLHRDARGHRGDDDLRVRRASRRRRVLRAGLPCRRGVAHRDPRRHRGLRVCRRLSVLRAVAEVRQRQRPAGQGGGSATLDRGVTRRAALIAHSFSGPWAGERSGREFRHARDRHADHPHRAGTGGHRHLRRC